MGMKFHWVGSHQELETLLRDSGYRRAGDLPSAGSIDEHWVSGSHWSLHPDGVPHKVHVHSNDLSIHVEFPRRWLLSRRDSSVLECRFSQLSSKRILRVSDSDSSSARGLFSSAFYDLSALFLGMLGTLLVLWLLNVSLIERARMEAIPRALCYQSLAFVNVGVPPYPDLAWYQGACPDRGGGLLLAFTQTFCMAFLPLAGLWLSSRFRVMSMASLFGVLVGVATLACVSVSEGTGFFPDILLWVFGPLAAIPGYVMVAGWRRGCEHRPMALPLVLSQLTAALAIVMVLFLSLGPALPRTSFGIPLLNNEAVLMIRDEVLKPNALLSKINDFYYHNTVSAMLPLRPPLGAKYHDRTVLYFGSREEVKAFFAFERTLPFIKTESIDWDLVRRGVPLLLDTSKVGPPVAIHSEAHAGPRGFELLLVDSALAGADFWERLATENPWLLERTAILHADRIEMAAAMEPTLGTVVSLQQVAEPGIYELIGRAILAVQFRFDDNASRRWIKDTGFTLLKYLGLPMLLLWTANGVLALITLWPLGGIARAVSLLVIITTATSVLPSMMDFAMRGPQAGELSRWNGYRSELAGVHVRLSELLDQGGGSMNPAMLRAIQDEIVACHELVIGQTWNKEFFADLDQAVTQANPKIRARAMATLQRLLGSIRILDLRLLSATKLDRLRDDRSLEEWTTFQKQRLPELVRDSDPIVAYWSLLCAEFADKDNEQVTQSVLEALESPDLNVRDKAVDAIRRRMTPDGMNKLAGMVSARPGGRPPETCDYVRLDAYDAILFNHQEFPPSKPVLIPASGK